MGVYTGDSGHMLYSGNSNTAFKVSSDSIQRGHRETFILEDLGSSKIALLSYQGKYLAAEVESGGFMSYHGNDNSNIPYKINANSDERGPREEFTVEQQTGGTIALKTVYGLYVIPGLDGSLKGDSPRTVAGPTESFTLECISGILIFYEH